MVDPPVLPCQASLTKSFCSINAAFITLGTVIQCNESVNAPATAIYCSEAL